MNKTCVYTTVEYYVVLKRKEFLTHARTWTNFEDIMQSKISQIQEEKYDYLHEVLRVVKFIQ